MQKVFQWRQSLQVSSPSKFSMPESFKATKNNTVLLTISLRGDLDTLANPQDVRSQTAGLWALHDLPRGLTLWQPRNKLSIPEYRLCHLSNPSFNCLWQQGYFQDSPQCWEKLNGWTCRSLEIVTVSLQYSVNMCRIVWIIPCLCVPSILPQARAPLCHPLRCPPLLPWNLWPVADFLPLDFPKYPGRATQIPATATSFVSRVCPYVVWTCKKKRSWHGNHTGILCVWLFAAGCAIDEAPNQNRPNNSAKLERQLDQLVELVNALSAYAPKHKPKSHMSLLTIPAP